MGDLFETAPAPAGRTDEWLTSQPILAALGGWQSFDLDPCAPAVQPWPTALATFTRAENGLLRAWEVIEYRDKSGNLCACYGHAQNAAKTRNIPSLSPTTSTVAGSKAGAALASAFGPETPCEPAGPIQQTCSTSLPPSSAMPTPKKGAKRNGAIPSSTTTAAKAGSMGCLSHGRRPTGQPAKLHGGMPAPIVGPLVTSPRTIFTLSAGQDAPAPSHGTCCPPVDAATPARATAIHSNGAHLAGSTPCCAICEAAGCHPVRRPARRVFLNPPYSSKPLRQFMARLAAHGWGTALIPAATDTETFARFVWGEATAVFFPTGRLLFHRGDGSHATRPGGAPQRSDHASAFCAYGASDADRLAHCGLPGQFHALRIPRGWLVVALADGGGNETWREAVAAQLRARVGTVRLDDLYRALANHPKARRNPNWRAKVRQQVQLLGKRTGRGEWRATA